MTRTLSTYFRRQEFACKCGCGFDTIDAGLIRILEAVRREFHTPVYINSACRCEAHNKVVGGSPTSQHVKGRAADIRVPGRTSSEVAKFVEEFMDGEGGIGVYETFVHVDSRTEGPARWKG
jgi:uncharacterized protein YcbK (DUF882 family)